jgi:hypothetical protein
MTLLDHHRHLIQASAIRSEVAHERGYRSVSTKTELRELGFGQSQQRVPALVLPLHRVNGDPGGYQIRADKPRVNNRGKAVKYELPRGAQMILDVPPRAQSAIADPSVPLLITEGVRKADSAVSQGLTCIALLGVWNWRGTNGTGGRAVLADWEFVALNDREVYIAFDSDVMIKPEVHSALARLAAMLESRHADVRYIYLPHGAAGAKVGLDDFFAQGSTTADLFGHASADLRALPGADDEAPTRIYRENDGGLALETDNGLRQLTNFVAQITREVVEDDGVERRLLLEISAQHRGRTAEFRIPARELGPMEWPIEYLGASAGVFPGPGVRDNARFAIQTRSEAAERAVVYSHTGWRELDGGWGYLHAGGAIGAAGPLYGVEVSLPIGLERFELKLPRDHAEAANAVEASIETLLGLTATDSRFALLAAVYRAALGETDFALHIVGPTGEFKTEIAALLQRHFGERFDARHLPASWASTANATEVLAHQAKDAALVVDDFAPGGSMSDQERHHRDAERLVRGQGNRAGRARLRSDGTLRSARPPRGLIVSTGEDVPKGRSLRARLLIVPIGKGDVAPAALGQAQALANCFSTAMGAFVAHAADEYPDVRAQLARIAERLRGEISADHRRTAGIVATLGAGLEYLLAFAVEIGAISRCRREQLWAEGWPALQRLGAAQTTHQLTADPALRFIELVATAVTSGAAHFEAVTGGPPQEQPRAKGWSDGANGSGLALGPNGPLIGWVDANGVYLQPTAAFQAAQRIGRDVGEPIEATLSTLKQRLAERRLLTATDRNSKRRTFTVRKAVGGRRQEVLQLGPWTEWGVQP